MAVFHVVGCVHMPDKGNGGTKKARSWDAEDPHLLGVESACCEGVTNAQQIVEEGKIEAVTDAQTKKDEKYISLFASADRNHQPGSSEAFSTWSFASTTQYRCFRTGMLNLQLA